MNTGQPTRAHPRAAGNGPVLRTGRHAAAETPTQLVDQASALLTDYDFAGAYQLLVEVRSRIEHGVDVSHTDAVDATRMLADTLLALDQIDDAAELLADLNNWGDLGRYQSRYQTAMLAVTRGRLLAAQHRFDDAEACYRDVAHHHGEPDDPARWPTLLAMAGTAAITAARGRTSTAEQVLTLAYTRLLEEYGTTQADVVRVGIELAELRVRLGQFDAARRLMTDLAPAAARDLGRQHPLIAQVASLADGLDVEHRDGDAAPTTTSHLHTTTAAAPSGQARRSSLRRASARHSLPFWAPVTAMVCLAAAAATALLIVAITAFLPLRGTGENPPAISPTTGSAWSSPGFLPAGDVRIVRDTGTTIDVAWTDPSGGLRPTILLIAKDSAPATVAATVPAATTTYRFTGLDPDARRYCVGVAVAYSTTAVMYAADMCTTRPAAAPSRSPPNAHAIPSPSGALAGWHPVRSGTDTHPTETFARLPHQCSRKRSCPT